VSLVKAYYRPALELENYNSKVEGEILPAFVLVNKVLLEYSPLVYILHIAAFLLQ
jgi:hypothetical protein